MWRFRLKLLVRHLSPRGSGHGGRNILILMLFTLFVALTSHVSWELFDTLRLTPEIGPALTFRVVSIANMTFCVMLIFSSVVSAALVLYANPEQDFLFALPIPPSRVFAMRFFESMAATGWMVFLFGTPIAVGLGRSFDAGWDYAAVAIASLLGLVVLPTALGTTLLCAAYVWIPRHRAKTLTFGLGVLAAYVLVSMSGRVDIGILFKMEFDPALHLPKILGSIESPSHAFTPDTLAAQAMAAAARGEIPDALKKLAWLWAENIAGLAALMSISFPLFLRGWAKNDQGESAVKPVIPFSSAIAARRPVVSLCLKDFKFIFRSISEWSQILVLITLIFVEVVNIRDLPLDQPYLINFVSFVNLAVSALLVVAVCVRFVYPTFSLEGSSAYLLKTMPLDMRDILTSKILTYTIPLMCISQALLFITNRQAGVSTFFLLFSHAVCAVQTVTIVLMALHSALLFPPRGIGSIERAAGSSGGILFMIIGSLYVAVCTAFFTAPIYKAILMAPITSELARPLGAAFMIFFALHLAYFVVWRLSTVRQFNRL